MRIEMYEKASFRFAALKIWKSLPNKILCASSYVFSRKLLVTCVCFSLLSMLLLLWCLYSHMKMFSTDLVIKNRGRTYYNICAPSDGRLGNNIFQYAAAYGIASSRDMRVLIANDSLIARYFNVDADILENYLQICSTFTIYHEQLWGIYNPSFSFGIPRNHSFRIRGYFQSYKYFNHVRDEIREQFMSFYEVTRRKAIDILHKIKWNFSLNLTITNMTLIGIHLRTGDKLSPVEVKIGSNFPSKEYFIKAIDYFTSKYENPVFVVCGENQSWGIENVPSKYNAVFRNPSSTPDVDLAVLSMCDHIILSIGSYGWWAAYLNKGKVVYYKEWINPGSDLSKSYKQEDYFPPDWIPM